MKLLSSITLSLVLTFSLLPDSAHGQENLLNKSIDATHSAVLGIVVVDSVGQFLIACSGTLIHPQVILTAGHANFGFLQQFYGTATTTGYVSFDGNAKQDKNTVKFDWKKDMETHPSQKDFQLSFSDTTGNNNPSSAKYIDVGLLFLNEAIDDVPIYELPKQMELASVKKGDQLVGVGYGLHFEDFSTMTPQDITQYQDGLRRQWEVHIISPLNDAWVGVPDDSLSGMSFVRPGDSGGPLLKEDKIVLGVWSTRLKNLDLASRIDNPKVLLWIRDTVKKRLGVNI